jgi:hypothetical protein
MNRRSPRTRRFLRPAVVNGDDIQVSEKTGENSLGAGNNSAGRRISNKRRTDDFIFLRTFAWVTSSHLSVNEQATLLSPSCEDQNNDAFGDPRQIRTSVRGRHNRSAIYQLPGE